MSRIETEKFVLGALLTGAEGVSLAETGLRGADFRREDHQDLFAAIEACHAERGATDPIVVGEMLSRRGTLQSCGGHAYLLDLMEGAPHDAVVVQSAIAALRCNEGRA